MQRYFLLALAAGLVLLLVACGGHGVDFDSARLQPGKPVQVPAESQQPAGLSGLPALGDLPRPGHEVSLLGPGWERLSYRAIVSGVGQSIGSGGTLNLGLAGEFNYAIYGIYGFDGDNGPTSARLLSPAEASSVFIGFSDYEHGRWLWAGPFSLPAGGGTIETEIPNSGNFVSPDAFVASDYRASYLAVAVADDGLLSEAQVELGVHGGDEAPLPPAKFELNADPDGAQAVWLASASERDPDFAGYIIERAPLLSGAYERLTPEPLPGQPAAYSDPDALTGESYRYRCACADSSGNLSLWLGVTATLAGPPEQEPVVIAPLPEGPLFGPQQITIDMSASFDPAGQDITSYEVRNSGELLYSGASEVFNLTLQPGCHVLDLRAAVGLRSGSLRHYLKIYPVWQDHAVFLSSPKTQPSTPRMLDLEGARDPVSGRVYYSGFDTTIPGWAFRYVDPFVGSDLSVAYYDTAATSISQPLILNGDYYIAVVMGSQLKLLRFDGKRVDELGNLTDDAGFNFTHCALAAAGDTLYAFGMQSDGVTHEIKTLQYPPISIIADYSLPEDGQALDAAWDPQSNRISVAYAGASQVYWFRFTLDDLLFSASASLGGGASSNIDVEIQPDSGEPALAYVNGGKVQYRWRNPDNSWGGPEEIDPSGGQSTEFALAFSELQPRILASEIGGQASVYERTGADSWQAHDLPFEPQTFSCNALSSYLEDSEEYLGCLFISTDRAVKYLRLNPDDTGSLFANLPATTGQGRQMFGTAGSDELHLVWRDTVGLMGHHLIGSPDGVSWNGQPDLPIVRNLDLASLADGTVYLSWTDTDSAQLDRWDGNAWVNEYSEPNVSPSHRPYLSHARLDSVHFNCLRDASDEMVLVYGNESDGYDVLTETLLDAPVYTGAALHRNGPTPTSLGTALIIGGSLLGYASCDVRLYQGLDTESEPLFPTERANDFLYTAELFGRNLAGTRYAELLHPGGAGYAWYASTGVKAQPLRFTEFMVDNLTSYEYLEPGSDLQAPFDGRYTVSAAEAQGLTGVALINSINGRHNLLEWSDYGRFERLPLPGPDTAYGSERWMNQAQLFVGPDGRWHIVYRDYNNDIIFVRSTI